MRALSELCLILIIEHIFFRLDFEEFQIQPPVWGDCQYDQFYVTGNGGKLPTLCGVNNGSHSKCVNQPFLICFSKWHIQGCHRRYVHNIFVTLQTEIYYKPFLATFEVNIVDQKSVLARHCWPGIMF